MLPSTRKLSDLEYADDIVLISTSEDDLQRYVDAVAEVGLHFGLVLKPSKCQMLTSIPNAPSLTIYGTPIETVEKFCYLGSTLTLSGSCEEDIRQRIGKARAVSTY